MQQSEEEEGKNEERNEQKKREGAQTAQTKCKKRECNDQKKREGAHLHRPQTTAQTYLDEVAAHLGVGEGAALGAQHGEAVIAVRVSVRGLGGWGVECCGGVRGLGVGDERRRGGCGSQHGEAVVAVIQGRCKWLGGCCG